MKPGAGLLLVILAVTGGVAGAGAQEEPGSSGMQARALVVPVREAVLSSEQGGRIVDAPLRDGDRFREGALLIGFDCTLHEANLDEARAAHRAAVKTLDVKHRLAETRSVGMLEVTLAEAQVDETAARVAVAKVPVKRCTVRAPFAGRVVEVPVNRWESAAVGTPLIAILDDSQLEIDLVIPSPWLDWLTEGAVFSLLVDETGTRHRARVGTLGARVDAVSQSIKIRASFVEPPQGLIAGMSGTAVFAPPAGR